MKQFIASIILAVVISSVTTYLLTSASLQNSLEASKVPTTSAAVIVQNDTEIPSAEEPDEEAKLSISSETTKVELDCSNKCDDSNPCTIDYCNETTNFKCTYQVLKGEVDGCKGDIEGTCSNYSCIAGKCAIMYSSRCCGNDKCDSDEDISLCPRDCQPTAIPTVPPSQSEQTALSLTIKIDKNPIVRGNIQTITLVVTSSKPIEGASTSSTVTYASGSTARDFSGVTNSTGEYSYSWRIGSGSTPGTFTVTASATKEGYAPASSTSSFQVNPASP